MSFNVSALNGANFIMSRSFATAGKDMSQALERISSGSRINRASDDFSGFAKVSDLSSEAKTYENRAAQLREHGAVVSQALDVANQIMSDLYDMESALDDAGAATEESKGIGASIVENLSITDSDGNTLISDSLVTDLGIEGATGDALSDITAFGDTGGIGDLAADSDETAVESAITELETFIKEVEGLHAGIQSHTALADVMASNSEAVSAAITQIDEAAEMAKYVDADIRQQAAVSMFAQANMSRRNISLLYR